MGRAEDAEQALNEAMRARNAQQAVNDLGAGPPAPSVYRTDYEALLAQFASPPPGWFTLGTHVDQPQVELEFWGNDGGVPIWERPKYISDDIVEAAVAAYKAPRLHVNNTVHDRVIDMRAALEEVRDRL